MSRVFEGVALGAVIGLLLGSARGAWAIHANRYLESQLYGIALQRLTADLNETVVLSVAAVLLLTMIRTILKSDSRPTPRSRFAWAAGVAVLVAIVNLAHRVERSSTGPRVNVVLITVDTLRADHLGAYGYARETSPRIDAFARGAVRFSHAACVFPKTGPSFASMMTSRYTFQTGVTGNGMHLDDRLSLLAEVLANAGYRTAAVVANPVLSAASGHDQGFETFVEMWRPGASQDAENVTAEATNWLKQMGGERPFFLWVHYIDPHTPYRPPPPYHEMFVGDAYYDASWTVELGPDWKDDLGTIPRIAHLGSRREVDYYIAEYDAEIRYSDLHIGALLDTIGAMNLLDESLMVFAADHGESLGDHNYFFEHGRFPYDATVRVPLLVRWPRHGGAGRVVETPVSLLDVVPTILDVASLPPLIDAAGTSLLPLIRGDADGRAPPVFTEAGYAGGRMYSVRNRRHKLIHVPKPAQQETMQGTPFELYDVIADPNERENLVGVDVETTRQMAKVMLEWLTHSNVSQGQNAKKVEPDLQTREAMRALGYIHD